MKRWIKAFGGAILFIAAWISLYLDLFNLKLSNPIQEAIETFPLWSLVALGAYALANIGLNLIFFTNCPEAAIELQKDINDAKVALAKHGLNVDY